MRAHVITVSTRAAEGVYDDRSGPILVAGLRDLGFDVEDPVVVADGEDVESSLRRAVEEGCDVVVTTGGTGLAPSDVTPEMTRRVLDIEAPGIAEAVRSYGVSRGVPTAALSRGTAGRAGGSFVVNLAGSTGAARDGLTVLGPILDHAVAQIGGADHETRSP